MEYLLKASAVIALFYFCYKLFLQHETFFESNRWFLLIGLITAVSIPFVVIPIYVEYTPQPIHDLVFTNITDGTINNSTETTFNLLTILKLIYSCGVIFFLGKLCIEFISLIVLIKKHRPVKKGNYYFIETETNVAPFSFFKWIIYNPDQFQIAELEHIIAHEKVHAIQFHSLDVILNQVLCIIFWFNPFIWFYKKDLQQNLEFIADQNAQRISDCEKSYQLVLLKSSVPEHQYILSNNFYNSLIKKRIIMLHKSKSNKLNALKYILILPVIALFLMSFNTKEILIAKELPISENNLIDNLSPSEDLNQVYDHLDETKENEAVVEDTKENSQLSNSASTVANNNSQRSKTSSVVAKQKIKEELSFGSGNIEMVLITKDFTDAEFDKIKKAFKTNGITVKFKNIKRNKDGEITGIKINVSSKKSSANYNINSDEAISPIKITFSDDNDNISIGNAHILYNNDNDFHFKTKEGNHKIHRSGSGNSIYVISDDDKHNHDGKVHENKIIIKRDGKHENIIHSKNVHVISGDDNKKIEIIIDGDNELHEDKDSNVFIIKGNGNAKTLWSHGDDENTQIALKTIGKGNTLFIAGDDKNPLIIIDGKEITKKEMENLNADTFETIEVLKGDNATEKYGKKAKDGVILITTKKKN